MILHHVSVGVLDVARAGRFYDAVLATLVYKRFWELMPYAICYGENGYDFWVGRPYNGQPASAGNGGHIPFPPTPTKARGKIYETTLPHGRSGDSHPRLRPPYEPHNKDAPLPEPPDVPHQRDRAGPVQRAAT